MSVYRVSVDGKEYQVEVGDLNSRPVQVKVNGRVVQVSTESWGAEPERAETSAEAAVGSTPMPVSSPGAVAGAPGQLSSELEVVAPMPGSIVSVEVEPGAQVAVGQDLCILDAMKMNNRIRAQRDGVIAQVHVHPGDQVQHGDKLFTFAES